MSFTICQEWFLTTYVTVLSLSVRHPTEHLGTEATLLFNDGTLAWVCLPCTASHTNQDVCFLSFRRPTELRRLDHIPPVPTSLLVIAGTRDCFVPSIDRKVKGTRLYRQCFSLPSPMHNVTESALFSRALYRQCHNHADALPCTFIFFCSHPGQGTPYQIVNSGARHTEANTALKI